MTATAAALPPRAPAAPRSSLRPVEGWLSLFATLVMAIVFAASLQDAQWPLHAERDSGYMLWMAILGVAIGVTGAKIGWGRWRTHFVGALFAGLVLPLIVGGIVIGGDVGWAPPDLAARMAAALGMVREVWNDLAVQGKPFTDQFAHYHLVFGALIWGAGMLAGFTVFGHRRPLDAVVVLGLALLANMALTGRNEGGQLQLLILFSAAALLLLIRTHVFEEEITWARRKIGDPAAVGQLYLRGGAAFVAAAVVGSMVLTATASSAPLQGLWEDLPQTLQAASQWLQRFAPQGGDPRGPGIVGFGESATTNGLWQPSDRVAFRAQFQTIEDRQFKWRAGVFSEYTTFGWDWGDPQTRQPAAARDDLLVGGADRATDVGRREIRFRVIPDAYREHTIVGPNMIQQVDRETETVYLGVDGWFTSIETDETMDTYNVLAKIRVTPGLPGGLNEAVLRAAGTDYPAELAAIYTALPPDAMGPVSNELLGAIKATAVDRGFDPTNPYDLARTMEGYLQDGSHFEYDKDVRDERAAQCGDASTVECFAIIKRGYCEFYASAMAVMLRSERIPTRIAYGFLPGDRGADGVEVVGAWAAHWWVEVYFPDLGWVEFDPTGGGVGQAQPLPSGSLGPPTARPSQPSATFREPTAPTRTSAPGSDTPGGGTGIGPFIAIAIILAIGVLALAYAAYRRTPSKPMHPDQAWGSLGRLAARFGLGPRPSQTVYEYAGALGEAVPDARVELTTIARAKVEVAYGHRDLGNDRLKRIAEAYHRLRFALLGLFLRRSFRRARRK